MGGMVITPFPRHVDLSADQPLRLLQTHSRRTTSPWQLSVSRRIGRVFLPALKTDSQLCRPRSKKRLTLHTITDQTNLFIYKYLACISKLGVCCSFNSCISVGTVKDNECSLASQFHRHFSHIASAMFQ